ncbi:MAG: YdcF family protein [Leptolinea sp.]
MKNKSKPFSIKNGASCIIGLAFFLFAGSVFLTGLGAILVIADPIKRADAVVILSGGDEQRMQEAILLYEEKYAGTIILTETGSKVAGFDTEYSFEQRLALIDAGIPSSAILTTQKHVGSTREEAKAVRSLVGNENTHDIIVVTDSYHTLRTRLIWREIFRDSEINIIVRPGRGSWYKSSTWWLSKVGWEATILEYVKLANYLAFQKVD